MVPVLAASGQHGTFLLQHPWAPGRRSCGLRTCLSSERELKQRGDKDTQAKGTSVSQQLPGQAHRVSSYEAELRRVVVSSSYVTGPQRQGALLIFGLPSPSVFLFCVSEYQDFQAWFAADWTPERLAH